MNKIKKISISLGSVVAIAAPVAAAISCGADIVQQRNILYNQHQYLL